MEAERNPIKLSRVKERNGTERKGKDLGREGERECVCINLWNNGTEREIRKETGRGIERPGNTKGGSITVLFGISCPKSFLLRSVPFLYTR